MQILMALFNIEVSPDQVGMLIINIGTTVGWLVGGCWG